MSTYCIGDIHGCYNEFMQMLDCIKFDTSEDKLILTGDLIGRGPKPLETMQEIIKLAKTNNVVSVLGNHDLNFLAVTHGIVKPREKDNLDPLLNSSYLNEILDFYLSCSLLYKNKDQNFVVTHAGIYPFWTIKQAFLMAETMDEVFKDPYKLNLFLQNMYGTSPNRYTENLSGVELWRFIVNAFTRMRLVYQDGTLDYENSSVSPNQLEGIELVPWYNLGYSTDFSTKKHNYKIVFGHWAALNGECYAPNIIALDTGCVWGNKLSSWCVEKNKIISVKSTGYTKPKRDKS